MQKRNNIKTLHNLKRDGQKIVCLTSYTYRLAEILDNYADILLVGDSLGMVLYGMDSTLPVSLDMMINHGQAVAKASKKALVVVDMPFGSYQESPQKAFKNAVKIIKKTGATAVKLEGGVEIAETIKFLTERGIAVMGHIGLKPQYFNTAGGFVVEGKDEESKQKLISDLKAIEGAEAFAIVLESVNKATADEICKIAKTPIIGIGASNNCDGQVLVAEDMLGLTEKTAKFVKKYTNIAELIEGAVFEFSSEVRSSKFPEEGNLYS